MCYNWKEAARHSPSRSQNNPFYECIFIKGAFIYILSFSIPINRFILFEA